MKRVTNNTEQDFEFTHAGEHIILKPGHSINLFFDTENLVIMQEGIAIEELDDSEGRWT
jgi:hypothetical protein